MLCVTQPPTADHAGPAHQAQPAPQPDPRDAGPIASGWQEGRDGAHPTYSERLIPGPALWLLTAMGVAALAVAYAKALGPVAGLILGIGGLLLAAAVILGSAKPVVVDSHVLRAGRARLPLSAVGQVIIADQEAFGTARGPAGDPSAHMVTAFGVNAGVVVEVTDPGDPHRTWLVASRRPADLACALRAARGKVGP